MEPKFLDTGYLLALELANDINHQAALRHWQSLAPSLPPLVTTSYVFDETMTFFNSRGFHSKAVQVGSNLLRSPSVEIIHVDEALFYEGWAYFQKYQDKQYSLTDCISFVVMQQRGISAAFAFDHHFTQAGFIGSHNASHMGRIAAHKPYGCAGKSSLCAAISRREFSAVPIRHRAKNHINIV